MEDLAQTMINSQQELTPLIQLFITLTFLMLLPTIVFMMTSFVRIIITFSFIKSALGATQSIPNQILIGIAIVTTIFIMSPTINEINNNAIQPYINEEIKFEQAIEVAQVPIKKFLLKG